MEESLTSPSYVFFSALLDSDRDLRVFFYISVSLIGFSPNVSENYEFAILLNPFC